MCAERNSLKVFVGVTEVAGYCMNLFMGFRKNGVTAGYLNLSNNTFSYSGYQSYNYRLLNHANRIAQQVSHKKWLTPWYYLLKIFTFIWVLFKFDVFIFATGSTFYKYLDYRLIKFFGKKIIHVSLGSDSRPQYINGNYKDSPSRGITPLEVDRKNSEILSLITIVEKYADIIINYPQHAHFHTRSFISGNYIGFPSSSTGKTSDSIIKKTAVRILHAPTRPMAKGSLFFSKIMEELSAEGYKFEYLQITNKTNAEVQEEIAQSDIILDELYSDLPLGGLGAEAAFHGKPVVVGGYYSALIHVEMEEGHIPPSCYCLPEDIKANLAALISDAGLRERIGFSLRHYVQTEWNAKNVAKRYLQLIENNYPPQWLYSPQQLRYLWGWGQSKDETVCLIKKQIATLGPESLHLSHNPSLESAYLSMQAEEVSAC